MGEVEEVRGKARVTVLKTNYAVLSKPGLDGRIFVVPSSIVGQKEAGYPDMHTLLHINDLVRFEARRQTDRNGIKWQALDWSVKVEKKAAELEYRDTGEITFVDRRAQQYGFIRAPRGNVWFNQSSVQSSDLLKSGKKVSFVAIKQDVETCPYKALSVQPVGSVRKEAPSVPRPEGVLPRIEHIPPPPNLPPRLKPAVRRRSGWVNVPPGWIPLSRPLDRILAPSPLYPSLNP